MTDREKRLEAALREAKDFVMRHQGPDCKVCDFLACHFLARLDALLDEREERECPGCLDCTPASLLAGSIMDETPRCGNRAARRPPRVGGVDG